MKKEEIEVKKENCRWFWKLFSFNENGIVQVQYTTVSRAPLGYKNLLILLKGCRNFPSAHAHVVFMASLASTRWKLEGEEAFYCHWRDRTFVMDHKVEWSTFLPKLCFPPWLLLHFFSCSLSFSYASAELTLKGISLRLL